MRQRIGRWGVALWGLGLGACGGSGGGSGSADSGSGGTSTADVGPPADAAQDSGPTPDATPTPDAAPHATGLTVILDGGDPLPGGALVWMRPARGDVAFVTCGGGAALCPADRLTLPDTPAELALTVKVPGYETLRTTLTPTYTDGVDTETVHLTALPAPEATDDYATGFAPTATLADLRALAFESAGELGPTAVVKWYAEGVTSGHPTVWFQNTGRHAIHYEFVHTVLGRALSPEAFEAATYHGHDRDAMAGSLILYPDVNAPLASGDAQTAAAPITMEMFPTDDLTPQMVEIALLALEARLPFLPRAPDVTGPNALYYLPAGSAPEADLTADVRADFQLAGLRTLPRSAMYAGVSAQYLNPGVAYGTLRLMTPEQLDTEVVSFEDILVLPRLPNRMPLVGGTITAELQTPLAHVNVAARARNTPNLALTDAPTDPRVAPLLGKLVRFEVATGRFTLTETTLDEARAYWADRRDRPSFAPPADLTRTGLLELADLGFADALTVGVKAANVAELSHLLGENAPTGFAVPFSEYRRFLEDTVIPPGMCARAYTNCLSEARSDAVCTGARGLCQPAEDTPETLHAWILRVMADPGFQSDSALREAALDGFQYGMRHVDIDPTLAAELDTRVADEFPGIGVRLRSSTNAEDLDRFTGAGLYDSTGAGGPSGQLPSEEIRKVWASAYNWRAFEERAFWNVEHDAVQVGVLVHASFPDEQVNGVLITQNLADPAARGFYVNAQAGEMSVTNPTDGALPEVFSIVEGPGGTAQVSRERFSSLNPDAPLLTDEEIQALYHLALRVQLHFAPLYGDDPATMGLDIEWKIEGPERHMAFKQVRPYALPTR